MMSDQSARDDYMYMTRHIKTPSPSEWIAQFVDPGDDGYYELEGQPLPSLPPLEPAPLATVIPFPVPPVEAQEENGQAAAA